MSKPDMPPTEIQIEPLVDEEAGTQFICSARWEDGTERIFTLPKDYRPDEDQGRQAVQAILDWMAE